MQPGALPVGFWGGMHCRAGVTLYRFGVVLILLALGLSGACAEGRHGADPTLEPRAFREIPLQTPGPVEERARLVLVGEVGTLEGPTAFGGIMSAALNPGDSTLAVLDSHDCSLTFVSLPEHRLNGRFGSCGDGPNELTSPTRMAFVNDSVLVFDPGRSRFAMVPMDGGAYRWFDAEVVDHNGTSLSQLSQVTDSTFLVARYLRSAARTVGDPGLVAEVSVDDGRIIREFMKDSPVALDNPSTTQGRRAYACALREPRIPLVAVANQWMGQLVLLRLERDGILPVQSLDVTPEWYVLEPNLGNPDAVRPPSLGGRVACGSDVALFSYRVAAREGVERTRLVLLSAAGEILLMQDYEEPMWPSPGVPAFLDGVGRWFVGVTNTNAPVPTVAVYSVVDDHQSGG